MTLVDEDGIALTIYLPPFDPPLQVATIVLAEWFFMALDRVNEQLAVPVTAAANVSMHMAEDSNAPTLCFNDAISDRAVTSFGVVLCFTPPIVNEYRLHSFIGI